jgi:hypothetical protein
MLLIKYSIITIFILSIVTGLYNNIPSFAQEVNQTQDDGEEKYTNKAEHAGDMNGNDKTSQIRDSVTILLQDIIIPGTDFLHLYDSTPSRIVNGHIALKAPCGSNSISPIQVLIGSAPNMTAATLENIPALSTPGEQCLYHVDLIPSVNVTTITDIALSNPTEDEIEFPSTSSVVIGVNQVIEGEHTNTENKNNFTESATLE